MIRRRPAEWRPSKEYYRFQTSRTFINRTKRAHHVGQHVLDFLDSLLRITN